MVTLSDKLPIHVAFFTGYIPPHALPVFEAIGRRVSKLTVLVSTKMEANRQWDAEFGDLDIRVQRSLTHFSRWRHDAGFSDRTQTHIPWDTYWQIRQLKPDVLVSEELGYRSMFCGLYRAIFRNPPLLLVSNLSEHTEQGRGRLRLWLRKWLSRRAAATTANGQSGLRYLESIGFPTDRLFHFPYTMSQVGFDEIPLHRSPDQAKRLICITELSQRKGVDRFLAEMSVWAQGNPSQRVHLDVFGTGPQETELKAMPLAENCVVRFRGYCDYEQIKQGMEQSGILVFPTLADEWGMVVNEALAAGLPVLGSRYSQAADELIVHGQNGWTYDPLGTNLPSALSEIFVSSIDKLESMRHTCRQSVAERTPEWAAEKFLVALKSVWRSRRQ